MMAMARKSQEMMMPTAVSTSPILPLFGDESSMIRAGEGEAAAEAGAEAEAEAEENDAVNSSLPSLPPEQRRHLMELESSFRVDVHGVGPDVPLAPTSPTRSEEMASPGLPEPVKKMTELAGVGAPAPVNGGQRSATPQLMPAPALSSTPAEPDKRDVQEHAEGDAVAEAAESTLSERAHRPASTVALSPSSDADHLEHLTSSPTVAAQARSISRAASAKLSAADDKSERAPSPRPEEIGLAIGRQPSVEPATTTRAEGKKPEYGALSKNAPAPARTAPRALPGEKQQQQRQQSYNNPEETANSKEASAPAPAGSNSLAGSHSKRSKQKFLRSRQTSQRSSVSSVGMDNDSDDGGSTVGGSELRPPLSRTTSLGSIASGITALADRNAAISAAADKALHVLDEEERSQQPSAEPDRDDDAPPSTPIDRQPPPGPTDTVIAAHVKNIQIPATVARDYRTKYLGGPGSPSKKIPGTPATASRGRDMTLKEQTASIDRLQKENFDLKIKIYYLNEKLEKFSDEGVKEALQENVDMKVKMAESLRERKQLKKRIRELEKTIEQMGGERRERAEEPSEEVWELRERVERYEVEIEEYRQREHEREERIRSFRRQATNGVRAEDYDALREVLATEQARRETAEAENLRLRDEIHRYRSQDGRPLFSRASSRTVSEREGSQSRIERNMATQLNQSRRENDELRRDLSAQASMLTSRNRERDMLYQQIEELKLNMRAGNPTPSTYESESRALSTYSDRLLDRSVSRAGAHSAAGTHVSTLTENEREDYENQTNNLRDRVSELRLKNQDLEGQTEGFYADIQQLQDELVVAQAEVQEMQAERNEALRLREEMEMDFEQLKQEAEEEIDKLEEEIDLRGNDIIRLQEEFRNKEEDFVGLQQEMRTVSDVVVRLEDAQELHQGEVRRLEDRIQDLQRNIHEGEQEMNVLETSLREANEKVERLTVQAESAKGEIAFLREEQDGDKMKIGELEGSVKSLGTELDEERERLREAKQRLDKERKEREKHGDRRQQEWQKHTNTMADEVQRFQEETRTLRKNLKARDEEATNWKQQLYAFEKSLRVALGDIQGSRQVLVNAVVTLNSDLEDALHNLEETRADSAAKDRTLNEQTNLLESMALESRKLQSLLGKERSAHRADKALLENLQASQSVTTRRISEHTSKYTELEKQRSRDSRHRQALEASYRERLEERNSLLLQSWHRLATACGKDWAQRNALVSTATPPISPISSSADKIPMEQALQTAMPSFTRQYLSAVKSVESLLAGFKSKIKGVERDLWKEYTVVESALDARSKRLDRLENLVRSGLGDQSELGAEIAKLRTENRFLRAELNVVKQVNEEKAQQRPPTLQRARTAVEVAADAVQTGSVSVVKSEEDGEKKWILRLRELEKRLKMEREARVLDRSMAKRKVEEAVREREEMGKELERERVRMGGRP